MKKIFALVLALMLVLGMVAALAEDSYTNNGGTKTITVHNAMKGEKAPSRAILYEEKFTEGNVSWHFTWSYYQKVRLSY